NTRRNPLPANRREAAIVEFSRTLAAESFVYMIDDVGESARFAEYMMRKIEVESSGRVLLASRDCVVACSTPSVAMMFERLGFRVLPVELTDREAGTVCAARPWDVLERVVKAGVEGRAW